MSLHITPRNAPKWGVTFFCFISSLSYHFLTTIFGPIKSVEKYHVTHELYKFLYLFLNFIYVFS
jgi:hypothetical protein